MVLDKEIESIVVVGKGPSLSGEGLGDWIDSHDTVIRLSNGLCDDDHGFRADYFLAVNVELLVLNQVDLSSAKGLWFYRTQGKGELITEEDWMKYDDILRGKSNYDGEITHINGVISFWLDMYKNISKPRMKRLHPHVTYPSKGTAAVLMAIETFKPLELRILGLDSIVAGKRTMNSHDFEAENRIIKGAAEEYSVDMI